ncbi:Alpha/Beta hydrolase protein [Hyaloscypha finlandica]|nr:Alpha/Beta hydrolase protein [Hyaloscypha finlandica]
MSLISDLTAYFLRVLASFTRAGTPAALTSESPTCRFRLDNESSDTITLPDGRKLGYAQYGSKAGRAIFYLHGLPGSRIEAAAWDELGQKLGARIIAADRPGIGWSSPHPGRTLLGHPEDLEYLAKHLELEEYGVLGISGGGPYALACAMSLPYEKLKCVSIVCGLGPPDIGRLDLTDERRLELLQQSVSKSEGSAQAKDLEVMKDEDFLRLYLRSTRESFAQGFEATLQDGRAMCMDWGFRIEDIRPDLPVQLWYGKLDTFVPLNHGVQIAARLGDRAHLRVEDETHASISGQRMKEEILRGLVSST